MSGQVRLLTPLPRILIDRDEERQSLLTRISAQWDAQQPGVYVLTGMPGVGKTILALWCADQLCRTIDFEIVLQTGMGASARARSVEDAMTIFLPALGVTSLPPTVEGMVAAYRAKLANRSSLIVLDDVESAEQLTDLLPAAPRSVVIATSRNDFEGFEYRGFTVVPIGVFTPDSAKELLAHGMDPSAAAAADAPLREVAELCGFLPLALGIARTHLRRHRGGVAVYADRLRSAKARLREFTIDKERLVEQVYELSYRELTDSQRRLYRFLSLHPGKEFGVHIAAALLDPESDHSEDPEDELLAMASKSLLTRLGHGRFEKHSLVHLHAAALLQDTDHPADCRRAARRMILAYLTFTVAREQVLSARLRFGELFDGRIPPAYTGEDSYSRAIADLESERANLRRAVLVAADEGFHDLVWQLCEALATFFFQRDLFGDAIEIHRLGLASALEVRAETGESRPVLRMHIELGTALFAVRDHVGARYHFESAGELVSELSDAVSVATFAKVFAWQGIVYQRLGEFDSAVAAMDRSRLLTADPAFPEHLRERENRMLDLNDGPMLAAVGRYEEAIEHGRRAAAFFEHGNEDHNYAKSIANLGSSLARAGLGHRDEAVALLTEAVRLEEELSLSTWLADSCEVLGKLLVGAGRVEEGGQMLARAAALFAELEDRGATALGDRGVRESQGHSNPLSEVEGEHRGGAQRFPQ